MGKANRERTREYDAAHPELAERYGDYAIAQQVRDQNPQLGRIDPNLLAPMLAEMNRRRELERVTEIPT